MSSVSHLCLLCLIRSSVPSSVHLLYRILSSVSSFMLVSHSLPCVIDYPLALSPSVLCHHLPCDCVNFRSLSYLSSSMSYSLLSVSFCRKLYSSPVFDVCHLLYSLYVTFVPLRHFLSSVSFYYLISCTTFSTVPFSFIPWCIVHDVFSSRVLPSATPPPPLSPLPRSINNIYTLAVCCVRCRFR